MVFQRQSHAPRPSQSAFAYVIPIGAGVLLILDDRARKQTDRAGAQTDEDVGLIFGEALKIAPGVQRTSTFVANWTREAIRLTGNQLGVGLKPYDER